MKKYKLISIAAIGAIIIAGTACKKQLNVGNPNAPTISANATSEAGLYALTQGSTFINGFVNGDGWLGNSYFSLPWGYSELLADNVGADAANQAISVISVPDQVSYGAGLTLTNPSPHIPFVRGYNSRANTGAGNNVLYYQWTNMYALNAACNTILNQVGSVTFSGDAATKTNTIKAWCYWWKGYAYASIGTQYYAGLIIDTYNGNSNVYKVKDSIIARSNYYYNLAATTLASITSTADYTAALSQIIPAGFQAGLGQVPTPAMWIRNINTMLARNILLNKLNPFVNGKVNAAIGKSSTSAMTAADWSNVLTLTQKGVQNGDNVFTGRAVVSNAVFTALGGTVSALTAKTNTNATFKITERFIQNYGPGDLRLTTNFNTATRYNNPNFTTRYSLIDCSSGAGTPTSASTVQLANLTPGAYQCYIGTSFEENQLMQAEANIMLGNINAGLTLIDAVRTYQGAGVPAVAGTGLSQSQAMAQLTSERRVALVFRGISFYDARRWGWTYAISNGGGYYNGTFLTVSGAVYNNAVINYNFLDYWDPPGAGSAPTVNPNF
jgi:hypothetical protein